MPHNLLYLTAGDLKELGVRDMKAAMDDVETTLALCEKGQALTPFKIAMEWPPERYGHQNRINAMPGYVGGPVEMAGVKWIGSNPKSHAKGLPRASALTILNDPDTKLPLCILDGTEVSAMRTGASGGLGVKYLAREDCRVMVLFGAGVQGRTQLEAACLARPSIERCWVSDLVPERAAAFAREMSEKLSIDVEPADDIRVRAREADLIVTATASDEPVVFPEDIHPGLTYIHIGGYECTAEAVLRADKLVFDDWSQVLHRGGTTPTDLFEQGLLPEERIYANLGQIICGQKPGRQSAEEYNYYNCVGLGVLDIAVAARLYRKAKARGVGITLPYWG